MKTMSMAEFKHSVSGAFKASQREDIIVTRHGRPVSRVCGVSGQDIIDVAHDSDPELHRVLRERSREPGGNTIEDVAARLGVDLRKRSLKKRGWGRSGGH